MNSNTRLYEMLDKHDVSKMVISDSFENSHAALTGISSDRRNGRIESLALNPQERHEPVIVGLSRQSQSPKPISLQKGVKEYDCIDRNAGRPIRSKARFSLYCLEKPSTISKEQSATPPRAPTRQPSLRCLNLESADTFTTVTKVGQSDSPLDESNRASLQRTLSCTSKANQPRRRRPEVKIPSRKHVEEEIPRNGGSLSFDRHIHILSEIHEESSECDGETTHFIHPAAAQGNSSNDSTPSCAKRRLSPQLETVRRAASDSSPSS